MWEVGRGLFRQGQDCVGVEIGVVSPRLPPSLCTKCESVYCSASVQVMELSYCIGRRVAGPRGLTSARWAAMGGGTKSTKDVAHGRVKSGGVGGGGVQ